MAFTAEPTLVQQSETWGLEQAACGTEQSGHFAVAMLPAYNGDGADYLQLCIPAVVGGCSIAPQCVCASAAYRKRLYDGDLVWHASWYALAGVLAANKKDSSHREA